MITCLLAGRDKSIPQAVDYEKINEITQGPDEDPSLFYCHLK
jgi:hypothetical protein